MRAKGLSRAVRRAHASGTPPPRRVGRRGGSQRRSILGLPDGGTRCASRLPHLFAATGQPLSAASRRLPPQSAGRTSYADHGPSYARRLLIHSCPSDPPMATLDQLHVGQRATVAAIRGDGTLLQRLLEMGLLEGEEIEVIGF